MTLRYVRSGAPGAGTGADWTNAYTTLAAALTAAAAGDTIYVSEDHAESQASAITFNSPGTLANPVLVVCVNHSGSVPPVSADLRKTATVTATGNSAIRFNGASTIFYGIIFTAGNSTGASNITVAGSSSSFNKFIGCSLRIGGSGNSTKIDMGLATSAAIVLEDTTVSFGSSAQWIEIGGYLRWTNTASALLGSSPTNIFRWKTAAGGFLECFGVDLSAAGSGTTIVSNTTGDNGARASLIDCKINALATKYATTTAPGALFIDYVRVGSSGANYNMDSVRYSGTLTEETTIVRTGGASDGITTLSWKIVTNANTTLHNHFESPPIAIWNDTTGSAVTATIQGIWGGGAVPNNDDIWVEVEYLGASGSPLGSFVNDGKADVLASNAGQAAGSGTWGGSTTKFALDVTFTPQQKGWIYARVKAAKVSSTFYVDPKIALT